MKEIDEPETGKKSESIQLDENSRSGIEINSDATSNGDVDMSDAFVRESDGGKGQLQTGTVSVVVIAKSVSQAGQSDLDAEGDGEYVEPGDLDSAENDGQTNSNRKRRHRRGKQKGGTHHRKWKPYTKMTWEERRELDERETKRACMKREERFASGHPVAPYNTTQFLMDDHKQELHIDHCRDGESVNPGVRDDSSQRICRGEGSGSLDLDSSEEFYDSPNDEELFMEKEFTETYENIHAERLQTMSKNELIREYIDLESKLEGYEKRPQPSKEIGESGGSLNNNTVNHNKDRVLAVQSTADEVNLKTLSKLESEIIILRAENEKLRKENELLTFAGKRCEETD